eukprot:Polyplicarium_translucidae@DN4506_c0_g1_i1.p1
MSSTIVSPGSAVKAAFGRAIGAGFPGVDADAVVVPSKFGDYQCNSAMSIFKTAKSTGSFEAKSPQAVAEVIRERLVAVDGDLFEDVAVAKAGFVTVTVASRWIEGRMRETLKEKMTYKAANRRRVAIDFSSPNIAKDMHVGHLRSTILGESISRLLEFAGHEVLRLNHLGDWGTQFGMLIEFLREEYPNFQENPPGLTDLLPFYQGAKKRFDSDAVFKKRAQLAVVSLQSGDATARAAWEMLCEISRKEFAQIYDRLDVRLVDRGESFYNAIIPGVLDKLRELEMVTVTEGATCVFTETDSTKRGREVPLMVVKSDGGYGYDSTDVAAIYHRLIIEKRDWLIYVTDLGQENHFMSIFRCAEAAKWHRPPETRLDHCGFGVVQGEDGKKFKTRSGALVSLVSLLDESVSRALAQIRERREEEEGTNAADVDPEADMRAASAVGYAAVKYFDLKQNRATNYKFSFEKVLDPRGNTAVYLLYAYARICAIFRKAGVEANSLALDKLAIREPEERALAMHIAKLGDVVEAMLEDLHVHRLAEFMYDLAQVFTDFYSKCRVVGSECQESRLLLCEATRKALATSFHLLGIQPLERL